MDKNLLGLQALTKSVARDVHEYIYSDIKLSDQEKPILIAGILIALEDKTFRNSYLSYTDGNRFVSDFLNAIKFSINGYKGLKNHHEAINQTFSFIGVNPNLKATFEHEGRTWIALQVLVDMINESIYEISKKVRNYDVLAEFYGEFSKHTGSDQQSLGIVLTPKHVASFMADLLNVTDDDVILDTCAGSGSLLLAADFNSPKDNFLVGIEYDAKMLTMAVANMMIRGVNAELYLGDSWSEEMISKAKAAKPTKFIINPPYSQAGYPELGFIKRALDCLQPGGLGVAIVPMSCAIKNDNATKAIKKEILKDHTLIATFSMPDQLFYPVGVVTTVMLFEAHKPHETESFFGYLKDDGFEITRTEGRKDVDGKWLEVKTKMEELLKERKSEAGLSAISMIDGEAEWCCEAYMQTDYSLLTSDDYEDVLKSYSIQKLKTLDKFEEA